MVVRESHDIAIDAMLADLFIHASNCARAFGAFHLAVSATPHIEPALMRLMYDPGFRDFPWSRTRLWMIDELDVAPDDPERRGTRLAETIMACSGIPESQCHYLQPGEAEAYASEIRSHLEWRERGHDRLDCCLFGAAEDGTLEAFVPAGAQPVRTVIDEEFVRSARLVSVLAPAAEESVRMLASWTRANLARFGPVGGELIWYLGGSDSADIPLA